MGLLEFLGMLAVAERSSFHYRSEYSREKLADIYDAIKGMKASDPWPTTVKQLTEQTDLYEYSLSSPFAPWSERENTIHVNLKGVPFSERARSEIVAFDKTMFVLYPQVNVLYADGRVATIPGEKLIEAEPGLKHLKDELNAVEGVD